MIPIYLLSYNRLTTLAGMVDYFRSVEGIQIVVVDNASTYPPLVDWLNSVDVEVIRLAENLGYRGVWREKLIPLGDEHRSRYGSEWYVVSDPDLDLTRCPPDLVQFLISGYKSHSGFLKVGLSLEIDDIPDHYPHKADVLKWESHYWKRRVSEGFFQAPIDTTFAVYHCDTTYNEDQWKAPSLRSDRPYTAKHVPWYLDIADLDEEEKYFLASLQRTTHWSHANRRSLLQIS